MNKYGIDNVRGGSFCKVKLNNNNLVVINKMIDGSTHKCYICGKIGHFAKNCIADQIPIIININDKIKVYNCKYKKKVISRYI